ncbi:MAG: (2Fe-2S)-binding protein [Alphaproteobacteria bacterium]|nr:(2Fe-2S)-binding protein [Alphaproteobacteria bacterium]
MSQMVNIIVTVNGEKRHVSVAPGLSVLNMLRDNLDLTGAKLVCGEGECGACTVIVDGVSVNSCLMYAVELDGREVTTVEGLQSSEKLDPVQQAFVDKGAIQCGYCTPGMVMQTTHLLSKNGKPNDEEIRRGLEGNVCRCTGYTKIIEAVNQAAEG